MVLGIVAVVSVEKRAREEVQQMTTPMFRTIAEYCTLDAQQARTWWSALSTARWSVPRTWTLDLVYFDQQPRSRTATLDAVLPFLRTTSPPARVVQVLEALVQERLLTRQEANGILERVLACVTSRGEWCWS